MMDGFLHTVKEAHHVTAVHLSMMELEADGERGLEPALAVSAPSDERVVEDAAVLIHDAVKLRLWQG